MASLSYNVKLGVLGIGAYYLGAWLKSIPTGFAPWRTSPFTGNNGRSPIYGYQTMPFV